MTAQNPQPTMTSFRAKNTEAVDLYRLLTGGICPRPVALVSTVSADGVANLAPFSFFNAFGADPPIVGFSVTRSLRDGALKDTYHNLIATEECVIQSVPFDIVEQVTLAAAEFPSSVSEWDKCGLTPTPSETVAPMRVAESPFQMECRLWKSVPLGERPGSGNLFLCEVILFHVAGDLLRDGKLDARRLDNVGRMGGSDYSRASEDALFSVPRARHDLIIGHDRLPASIQRSSYLTGNQIARLATYERLPDGEAQTVFDDEHPGVPSSASACERLAKAGSFATLFRASRFLLDAGHPQAERMLERSIQLAIDARHPGFGLKAAMWLETRRKG